MKGYLKYIYIISLSLFLGSCFPGKEISFEALQAADYQISSKADSILVLNLAYYPWVDTLGSNVLTRVKKKEQRIVDTMLISSIFDGFFSVIDNSMFKVLTRNMYYEIRGESEDNYIEPLSIESVDLLCEEFNVSIIIALEYYGMDFNYDRYVNNYGDFIADLSIDRSTIWRIYQLNDGMIKDYNRRDTLFWTSSGTNKDNADFDLPKLITASTIAFRLAGESFGGYISPSWKEIQRNYYQFSYEKGKDYSLDKEQLFIFTEGSNQSKSYKAWFNLAVIYEKEGDPLKALEALNKADLLKPDSEYVKFYKLELDESLKKRGKLLEQIGIEEVTK